MEKVNTRLVVVLLLGVLLAGQAAGAAEEASSPSPQLGASKADCEVSGTCEMKATLGAADPTRPGAVANTYTRGCSAINQCRG
ncbi:hypothetical protein SETIT_5G113200v2 [Setaria italica]|uniref:Rapid alkalinization factor 1 n=2 Tax=Setaria TaxID=4554 RepID=A0A368R3J9_SETIT|nr:hypothetical protein SETIT_5G113200v2 [Setaria italica]TKW13561.1 hypothetical protein SEVIR_5G109900v2 [Setaria viridis]